MIKNLILTLTLLAYLTATSFSQSIDYANDWYVSNPNRPFIKLLVDQDAVYGLDAADFAAAGVNLSQQDADSIQLFYRGIEVPLFVKENATGGFHYLEFVGKRNDGAEDAQLYRDGITGVPAPEVQPRPDLSIFSDTSAYFLTWGSAKGLRYLNTIDTNYLAYTPETVFPSRASWVPHPNSGTAEFVKGGGAPYDVFNQLNHQYVIGEGYVSKDTFGYQAPLNITLLTTGALPGNQSLSLEARVFGSSNTSHHHRISINGDTLNPLVDSLTSFSVPILTTYKRSFSAPLASTTTISFEVPSPQHHSSSRLCYMHLYYDRAPHLQGRAQDVMYQWKSAQSEAYFQFDQAGGTDSIWAYDEVNRQRHRGIISNGNGHILIPGGRIERDLQLVTDLGVRKPLIKNSHLSLLSDTLQKVTYLIIAHRSLDSSALAYAAYRDTSAFGKFQTKVVFTDEIYDEFGYGSPTPWAIKRFLNYTKNHWHTPPSYLLLWGKGRHLTRQTSDPVVPTYGYPASDFALAAPLSDSLVILPNMSIGRVNALTDQEGFAYLDKVREFEYSPYEDWRRHGVFLGGGSTAGVQNALFNTIDYMRNLFEGPPFNGTAILHQRGLHSPTQIPTYQARIDSGVALVQIAAYSTNDTMDVDFRAPEQYQNYGKCPMVIGIGAEMGDFSEDESFGEKWLKEPGRGAIAYFAPTSIGYLSPLNNYITHFYRIIFQDHPQITIGKAVRETYEFIRIALPGIQYHHTAQMMNLQGDPALRIFRMDSLDVWPGDTDADGIAHHVDVLNIGLAYRDTGAIRPVASLQWQAQRAFNWDSAFHTSINHKHADCNGDGIVNADDTLAIDLNYGLTHQKTSFVSGATPLILNYPSLVDPGDSVAITIDLGDGLQPAQNAYGIAFTLSYDPEQVEPGSLTVSFDSCWMGTAGSDLLTFIKDRPLAGELDIAITRTDHSPISGHGQIARVDIIMVDDLNKKLLSTPLRTGLGFGLAQDEIGDQIPLDDVLVPSLPQSPFPTLQVYPNPTFDKLCLLPGKIRVFGFRIYDITGRKMLEVNDRLEGPQVVDVSNWAAGVYVVKYVEQGIQEVVKVVKQ